MKAKKKQDTLEDKIRNRLLSASMQDIITDWNVPFQYVLAENYDGSLDKVDLELEWNRSYLSMELFASLRHRFIMKDIRYSPVIRVDSVPTDCAVVESWKLVLVGLNLAKMLRE